MPQMPMPLPATDYRVMNTSRDEFLELVQGLAPDTQYYVINATHRLAEVDWLTRKLEEQIRTRRVPVVQEGLLSLQLYLLLTCADTLGHIHSCGYVRKRFMGFFAKLPQEAKHDLVESILTWKTDFAELASLGLGEASTNAVGYPSRRQVLQAVQRLTLDKRLEAVAGFLYLRRNDYTHQSEYPQLGLHPSLSVMQRQRLNAPNIATLGELDRLQMFLERRPSRGVDDSAKLGAGYITDIYFTFYESNDAIATIRLCVLRGLGRVIGCV